MTQIQKAALYVRVSTADQKGGMESQTLALRTFCERNNINDYEIFTDENQSGAKASRPALDRMMKAVKDGQLNKIIVFSFSRLARSTVHLLAALDQFKKSKVQLISLSEQIDTNSPIGVALFTILGSLAQLERELIIERVRSGLANAKAKGKHIGRKKTRPSELIRVLLSKNLPYRTISQVSGASHGAIYAEKLAILKEQEAKKRMAELPPAVEPQALFPEKAAPDVDTSAGPVSF